MIGFGSPARSASMHSMLLVLCIAIGAIAWSRAVVWLHPLGPPKSSRTVLVNPRAIDSPTSLS